MLRNFRPIVPAPALAVRAMAARRRLRELFRPRIVVVGTGVRAAEIADYVARGEPSFRVAGFIHACGDLRMVMGARLDLDRTEDEQALLRHVRAARARAVVVATDERRGMPVQQLLHCKVDGIDIVDHLTFWERETRSIDPDAVQPGWLIYSHGFRRHALSDAVRRLVDMVASLCLLTFVLPVLIAAAVALKLDGGGPIVVGDERVGRNGASFRQLAFRTTRPGRASPIGAIVRRFRVDELLLLVNVFKGDLSFIGPAAEAPRTVDDSAKRVAFYRERHGVKPGLTGWAQVNRRRGAARTEARVALGYDLYYVKNRTLWLDGVIMARAAWGLCFPRRTR